ncbi:Lysine/arginine permease [Lachnellula suecica]|uniref:Lysine/arginine permease n=1 Tax=Lachnellula suecica TaxID=602035 RepID=A0A8T9CDE4_9HELO|nr:Lysine/arginine permease [Lachnellula suecica]
MNFRKQSLGMTYFFGSFIVHANDFCRKVLNERHVNMIAFSACIGVGLFLQSGKVIFLAGPGLAVIAYILSGSIIWSVISSLGEMTALFPIQGGLFVFPARFLDEGVGYAVGWMTWFSWVVIVASEILAVSQLWNFRFTTEYLENAGYSSPGREPSLGWRVGQDTNPAVWVFIWLIFIFLINCLPVLWYGRLEYIFGCMKMVFLCGLILFNVIINSLQRVKHPPNGGSWTYDKPYGFASHNITVRVDDKGNDLVVVGGNAGVFLAMWTAMTTIIFSMIGFETVSITAPECAPLRSTEAIKMGTRKTLSRVVILYTLCTLVVGFNVPYTDPNLRDLTINSIGQGQNSIYILAAVRNNIHGWPNFFNGVFIFSATTSGINSLYLSSRILHALASNRDAWPETRFFQGLRGRLERTTWGVPYNSIFASWLFGLLAFLSTKQEPTVQLGRLATNSVVSMLIVYALICASYLRFYDCIDKASTGRIEKVNHAEQDLQAFNRRNRHYPFKSRGQWLKASYGLVGCCLLAFFNGWRSFVSPFSAADFVASYISVSLNHIICSKTINLIRALDSNFLRTSCGISCEA